MPTQRSLIATGGLDLQKASSQQVMRLVDDICHHTGLYLWSLAIIGGSAWKMEGVLAKFWKKNLADSFKGTAYESIGQQTLLRGLHGAEPTLSAHAVYSLDWYHPTAVLNAWGNYWAKRAWSTTLMMSSFSHIRRFSTRP